MPFLSVNPACLRPVGRALLAPLVAMVLALGVADGARAQGYGGVYRPPAPTTDALPELEGVTIEDKLGATLPLDTPLVADDGRTITLRDILAADRPVVLQIGYMRCPMLCSLVMNALVRGLQDVDLTVGKDYDVISLSIDPNEKHDLAAAKKAGYVAEYGRGEGGAGWHFLTGEEANVRAVADAVGFQYRKQPDGEYSHAAAVFLVTPGGRLSRVLYGVKYEPSTLRMGLIEASEGRIGSVLDRIILWCHVYNGEAGGYVLFAMRLMKIGGALTVLILGAGLLWFWSRDASRRHLAPPAQAAATVHHVS